MEIVKENTFIGYLCIFIWSCWGVLLLWQRIDSVNNTMILLHDEYAIGMWLPVLV